MTRLLTLTSLLIAAPLALAASPAANPGARARSGVAADLDLAVRRWLELTPPRRNEPMLARWARAIGAREPAALIDAVSSGSLHVEVPVELRATVDTALIDALGRLGDPAALPALRAAFLGSGAPSVRSAAARGLGTQCGDAEAKLLLAHSAAADPLLPAAIEGLGRCLRPDAAQRLGALLAAAPDAEAVGPIAAALGRLASASVWSAPLRRGDPVGDRIRATAARALAQAIARLDAPALPRALAIVDHVDTPRLLGEARVSADAAGVARLAAAGERMARRRRVP